VRRQAATHEDRGPSYERAASLTPGEREERAGVRLEVEAASSDAKRLSRSAPCLSAQRWDPRALLANLAAAPKRGGSREDRAGGSGGGGGGGAAGDVGRTPLPPCVLVLSGSLNPVHAGHLDMFTAAAAHLRGLGRVVVGGVLAPSSDEWVVSKFAQRRRPERALSLAERVHLCRLALDQVDTVAMHVCDWGWASATQIMRAIRTALAACHDNRLPLGVTLVELAGTDVMMRPKKARAHADRLLVGFARSDADPAAVALFAADCDREAKTTGTRSRYLLQCAATSAVSSSCALDALFSAPRSHPSRPAVSHGVLHPKVAEWLVAKWTPRRPPT